MPKAIVLLSGGLDSATTLAICKAQGFETYALTFRYGQRHESEVDSAISQASEQGVERHIIVDVDIRSMGGSSLTADISVPRNRSLEQMGSGVPSTYVPARNTIFLSYALGWAEVIGAADIFIGVNSLDYAGYPDCRPDYIDAFERLANLATGHSVSGQAMIRLHAPLISMTKSQIIRCGLEMGVNFGLTSTCYSPSDDGLACGECDACRLRLIGFEDNSIRDPLGYSCAGLEE